MYIPPASLLKNGVISDDNQDAVKMPREFFLLLLRAAFEGVFDSRWYRTAYPDVAEAVDRGNLNSELDHFIEGGYWEGRMPCMFDVDEEWYKRSYPDVFDAVAKGDIASAHAHFNKSGYHEGRAPDAAAALILARWKVT